MFLCGLFGNAKARIDTIGHNIHGTSLICEHNDFCTCDKWMSSITQMLISWTWLSN